jgi:hypothetical protein
MKYFLYSISIILIVIICTSFKLKRTLFVSNPKYPFNIDGLYYTNQSLSNHSVPRIIFFYENGLNRRLCNDTDTLALEFDSKYYEQNYIETFPKRFNISNCDAWIAYEQGNDKIFSKRRMLDGPFHFGIYMDTITIIMKLH